MTGVQGVTESKASCCILGDLPWFNVVITHHGNYVCATASYSL